MRKKLRARILSVFMAGVMAFTMFPTATAAEAGHTHDNSTVSGTPAPVGDHQVNGPLIEEPTPKPTVEPTAEPKKEPKPTVEPTAEPKKEPKPTAEPTAEPKKEPKPTVEPTAKPKEEPTASPEPSSVPEATPTPTAAPKPAPGVTPNPKDTVCPDIAASSRLLDKLYNLTVKLENFTDTESEDYKALEKEIDDIYTHAELCGICMAQMDVEGAYHEKFFPAAPLALGAEGRAVAGGPNKVTFTVLDAINDKENYFQVNGWDVFTGDKTNCSDTFGKTTEKGYTESRSYSATTFINEAYINVKGPGIVKGEIRIEILQNGVAEAVDLRIRSKGLKGFYDPYSISSTMRERLGTTYTNTGSAADVIGQFKAGLEWQTSTLSVVNGLYLSSNFSSSEIPITVPRAYLNYQFFIGEKDVTQFFSVGERVGGGDGGTVLFKDKEMSLFKEAQSNEITVKILPRADVRIYKSDQVTTLKDAEIALYTLKMAPITCSLLAGAGVFSDGTKSKNQTIDYYEENPTAAAIPTRKGFKFLGYYGGANLDTQYFDAQGNYVLTGGVWQNIGPCSMGGDSHAAGYS